MDIKIHKQKIDLESKTQIEFFDITEKVQKIISEIKEIENSLFDNFYWNYYLWYAKEIIKDYDKALEYYNKAYEFANNDNKVTTSIILTCSKGVINNSFISSNNFSLSFLVR